jgi:hypothetical protein
LGGGEYASADELSHALEEQTAQEQRLQNLRAAMADDGVANAVQAIRTSLGEAKSVEEIEAAYLQDAATAWFQDIPHAAKEALWVAPSKVPDGEAPFTTRQREIMMTKTFRQAYYGTEETA